MKKYIKNLKRISPLTIVFALLAVFVCAILAANGIHGDWQLAAFAPCLSSLADNIAPDCDAPRVRGYEDIGIIVNRNDLDWAAVTYATGKHNIVDGLALVSGAGIKPYVIYQPRTNPARFNGTQSELSTDTGDYTKTLQFYYEGIGGDASENVVEPLKNGEFVAILQRKNHRGDGSFQIIGLQAGLVATAQVQNEETGYWLMTMTSNEPSGEISFFKSDYATTKAMFDALAAQA